MIIVNDADLLQAAVPGTTDSLWRSRPLVFTFVPQASLTASVALGVKDFGYRTWALEHALFDTENFNRRDDDRFDARSTFACLSVPEERELTLQLRDAFEVTLQ